MSTKKIGFTAFVAIISALATVIILNYTGLNKQHISFVEKTPVQYAAYIPHPAGGGGQPIDFRYAAAISTPCVVHITSTFKPRPASFNGVNPFGNMFGNDFLQQFFQGQPYNMPAQQATGSGVIVSPDGYIVTNNHVIQNADEVEVQLQNNKTYKAKVIGKDPDTDIALLKVDDDNLPYIEFANSDSVEIGEWVLAVGNPFNLSSTVTAGIVSAKGRNIDLPQEDVTHGANTAIESFIQTDAAVNPGNSGGALVDLDGRLVGITCAIASPTGSYAGYSFAVPSNITKKVIIDLEKYGISQRGFLGVTIKTMDDETAKKLGFDKPHGVYVDDVSKDGAADLAGLKSKDVITKINDYEVNSSPELQEKVGEYRPGDQLKITFIRDGKEEVATVTLKNKYNSVASVDNSKDIMNDLGIKVENLSANELRDLGLTGGVKITDVSKDGKLAQATDIHKGFVITQIDDQNVNNVQDFENIMKGKEGKVMVEGVYPNKPMSYLYAFRM